MNLEQINENMKERVETLPYRTQASQSYLVQQSA